MTILNIIGLLMLVSPLVGLAILIVVTGRWLDLLIIFGGAFALCTFIAIGSFLLTT